MITEGTGELADPDDLPPGLSPEMEERLENVLQQLKDEEEIRQSRDGEWDRTSNKVTKSLCDLMNELRDDGVMPREILSMVPVSSPNTIYYHLRGDCSHEYRAKISYDECGWMLFKATNGASSKELSESYDVSQECVARHVTGRCQHKHNLEPLTGDELFANSKEGPETTTSICPECGEEFEHEAYRERRFCSNQCNSTYAARKGGQAYADKVKSSSSD
jgi:hypothetical protein